MADRRAETTRESRRLLIEAAAGLFVEKGYQQTTFADVAARSGVSRGSIPWHFGNKEGLLAAVLDDAGNALLAGPGEPSGDGSPNPTEDLLAASSSRRSRMSLLFVALFAEAANPDSPSTTSTRVCMNSCVRLPSDGSTRTFTCPTACGPTAWPPS